MALVNLFILAILVCLSVTVFSYSALPSRLNSKLALRQTRLYNTIHESAAAGDLATVMEVVSIHCLPKMINYYIIVSHLLSLSLLS